MATAVQTHEGEVAVGLDLADLLALVLVLLDHKVRQRGAGILALAGPLQSLGPGLVAEPVADEIGIAGVDKDGDLLKDTRHQAVEGLHPVAVEEEVAVDVEVARFIAIGLGTQRITDALLVEVVGHVAHAGVAQVGLVLTLAANVVRVLASLLVGSKDGVVAVNGGRDTDPGTLTVVAGLDHGLAAGQGVVHGPAGTFVQDGRVATITAGHGAVVVVLGQAVSQTIANQHRLEVDVALLVGEDLRGESRDVVASVGLASNVEVLLGVLRELLEEQRQQSVDILARSHSVADGRATVGVAHVDGLVQEDHRGIGVPRELIVDGLDLAVDGARAKLHEEASEGGAARAAVQPEDNGVILGVVAGLEEPCTVVRIWF